MPKFYFWSEVIQVWNAEVEADTFEKAVELFEVNGWDDCEMSDIQPEIYCDCDDWNSTRIV